MKKLGGLAFALLLYAGCGAGSATPAATPAQSSGGGVTVIQTAQGVCIFHENGAVACPSATELLQSVPGWRVRIVEQPAKPKED